MKKIISIIIPILNEELLISKLCQRLGTLTKNLNDYEFELIFVDDGSTDKSLELLKHELLSFSRYKILSLSRNFGLQSAYKAGLDHSSGDAIVYMDGDLQDPPELISEMVSKWEDGADTVIACRKSRAEKGLKRFFLDKFHHVFNKMCSGIIPKDSGTFGLMNKKVAHHVRKLNEKSPFIPALRCWPGFEIQTIYYDRDERFAGKAKQSFKSLIRYAWDGITSFSDEPLKFIVFFGFAISSIAFVIGFLSIIQRILQLFGYFKSLEVLGFTSVITSILFIGGLQIFFIGVIGTYISRIFNEVKNRPEYIVKEIFENNE